MLGGVASQQFTGYIQKFTLHDDTRLAASWDARDQADYASTTLTSGGVVWTSTGAIYRDPYDLDVVLGTAANLTPSTLNGVPCVHAAGGVGIETTVAPALITTPMTMFLVSKTDAITGATQVHSSARSLDTAAPTFYVNGAGNLVFSAGTIVSTGSASTSAKLLTARHNGDASSSIQQSGFASVTGDVGAENYDYGTLFSNPTDASFTLTGSIGRHIIFDRALTDLEVALMQRYLIVNSNL